MKSYFSFFSVKSVNCVEVLSKLLSVSIMLNLNPKTSKSSSSTTSASDGSAGAVFAETGLALPSVATGQSDGEHQSGPSWQMDCSTSETSTNSTIHTSPLLDGLFFRVAFMGKDGSVKASCVTCPTGKKPLSGSVDATSNFLTHLKVTVSHSCNHFTFTYTCLFLFTY